MHTQKGRHHNVNIISDANTIKDLNTEPRDITPAIYFDLKSSKLFIARVEEKFNEDSICYGFKQNGYGIIKCNTVDNHFIAYRVTIIHFKLNFTSLI